MHFCFLALYFRFPACNLHFMIKFYSSDQLGYQELSHSIITWLHKCEVTSYGNVVLVGCLDTSICIHVKHHFDAMFEPLHAIVCYVHMKGGVRGHASTKSAKYFIPSTSAGS